MSNRFSGRVVVVTGASSGIGRCLSIALAKQGARLALLARREDRLELLADRILSSGGFKPIVCACDVGDWKQVEAARKQIFAELGSIDILVNNAGRGAYGQLMHADPSELDAVVRTNLLGAIYVTRVFLPDMIARRNGHIVFVSSVLGELPAPHHAVYGSTKFAVTALAESLRHELWTTNIDVTTVEPGLVRSEFATISGTPDVRFKQLPFKTAEHTAELIVDAIRRKCKIQITDSLSAFSIGVRRHFPGLFSLLFGLVFRKTVERDSRSS